VKLQIDVDAVQQWCGENFMQIVIQKTKIMPFACKTDSINFNYFVKDVVFLHSNCIKNFGVTLVSLL
jgi:hypothetical protein